MINSGDTTWILISTALVMLMTPALGLFYGGMVGKKNVLSTIMMSFVTLSIISLQWVIYGYSLCFGKDVYGIIGGLNFLGLQGVGQLPNPDYAGTIPHIAFMLFQMMFAVITPALITGCYVERVSFGGYLVFTLLWETFVYDPVCHWVWGIGGWLRNWGVLDFAGGIVVHISAGVSALAASLVIGKRKGYGKTTCEPSNIPLTILGAFLLWFGWFGFNGGSALTSGGLASNAFLVTNIAGAACGLMWMLLSWNYKRPSALGFATGCIVGLATITPASGYVGHMSAIIIGLVSAFLGYYAILLRMKTSLDDSLDVFACHGIGGMWGVIATGIFAQKAINPSGADGLLYGNLNQFLTQVYAVAIVAIYSFAATFILAKLVDIVVGLRVMDKEEVVGLDISQHAESIV